MKVTESSSLYNNLDQMSVKELLTGINNEDAKIHIAVQKEIPQIEKLVTELVDRIKTGGRLFYLGAGTSGRLGIVDASECPPTFGVPHGWVVGLIAGGDEAIRNFLIFNCPVIQFVQFFLFYPVIPYFIQEANEVLFLLSVDSVKFDVLELFF